MKSKIKGCTHHETKVMKFAEGGKVEPKVLRPKKMKDGSQQWTRGDTKSERLETLIKAGKTADDNWQVASRKTNAAVSEPKADFQKALKNQKRLFKGSTQLHDAFINELDDEE